MSALISHRHPSVARMRRLARRRRARSEQKLFVVDGPTLLDEALAGGVPVIEVVAEEGADPDLVRRLAAQGATVRWAGDGVLERATDTVSPQPVAAVAAFCDRSWDELAAGLQVVDDPLVVVLVGVNDPGNLGTLLRSAAAVGAAAVVCCDGTVDLFNPKTVRASGGSLFRVPVVRDEHAVSSLSALGQRGLRSFGGVVRAGTPYDQVDLTGPTVLVVGSEAHGLSAAVTAELDERVTIPMAGPVESLNVAMAGTVLCFEALRQRRHDGDK